MSMDEATTPPQYIVTTPSEAGDVEEDLSQHDNVGGSFTKMGYPRTYSLTTTPSVSVTSSTTTAASSNSRIMTQSTRSQSLQSSSTSSSTVVEQHQTSTCSSSSTLSHQLKAKSSASIVTEQRSSMMQKTSSISSASGKSKFQSFLQQPENTHPSSMGGGGFLTAHQKHVRQFVRSTSAHSEATASAASSRPEKCIRSASTQIEEPTDNLDTLSPINSQKFGLNQSSSILISKSAETIEMHKTVSASSIRTQLTLSGGLLAPPNRKITILSPIHAPPGLHDMLKRHGRSPLSPRISFPGSETDLFGNTELICGTELHKNPLSHICICSFEIQPIITMSMDEATTPPQYIVTTPSEAGDVEEDLSQHDNVGGSFTKMGYPRTYSLTTTPSVSVTSSTTTAASSNSRIMTQSTRSQSLQSSSTSSSTVVEQHQTSTCSSSSTLSHQLKAKSSASIVTEQRSCMMQKTSSISSASGKSKFQSFLQQPENTHPSSMGGGGFLTAHQKHVRQFVRSTSAHSEATASAASSRPEKCIRSASTQIEEPTDNLDTLSPINSQKFGLNQSSSILISKSAETIEMHKTVSASSIRTQLTLSGGLLAPPNRKITILSPIHAPPGLHDMLKRHGRSPLSPRISFPGSETDLFG